MEYLVIALMFMFYLGGAVTMAAFWHRTGLPDYAVVMVVCPLFWPGLVADIISGEYQ